MSTDFNILFLGDIIGHGGRLAVNKLLPALREKYQPDYIIANGENLAGGFGITKKLYEEMLALNIDVLTGGNHVWDKREIFKEMHEMDRLLRPLNYNQCQYGQPYRIDQVKGKRICTISLLGRVYISYLLECPFTTISQLLATLKDQADIFIIDFHAEVTSEKKAMARYLDGRATAILGTHTHVQTADARIMARGTANITDVGMVGPVDSVIGMEGSSVLTSFLSGIKQKFNTVDSGRMELNAVSLQIDTTTNLVKTIEPISMFCEV